MTLEVIKLLLLGLIACNKIDLNVLCAPHSISVKSPYYQHLLNCSAGEYKTVLKKTSTKGIVCPMIKDEVRFILNRQFT